VTEIPGADPVVLNGVLLGVDFGLKRAGLAICDREGRVAVGAGRIEEKTPGALAQSIHRAASERMVAGIVLGLPSATRGNEELLERVQRLAESLAAGGFAVTYWLERFSTASALADRKFYGGKGKGAKEWADEGAAVIILQDYLDWKRGRPEAIGIAKAGVSGIGGERA